MTKLRHYDDWGMIRFVTFSCYRRYRLLCKPLVIRSFLDELRQIRERGIRILGYVVMPEHVHLVLSPPGGIQLGREIGVLKSRSARRMLPLLEGNSNQPIDQLYRFKSSGESQDISALEMEAQNGELKRSFWHRRCYDHNCRNLESVREKIEYCHKNPVTRSLVAEPGDYPWSSYRWYAGFDEIELKIDGFDL